ncbi:CDP-alcohol phosphatidyltransferase family protein [Marinilactibacillus kalidii]|uniref:CDP-alcohol phosphatidyltransferase family protein n=1 Tax=Marinilactibacillus kalidii TaxID=2820274 RepID=UPI001ABE4904|nr:CDP-alcohol phosphatidyltransferase family protein [Marinilactibacillus kalidii]
MKINKEEWLKVPNLLSYFRLVLIPIFSYTYVQAESVQDYFLATGILFLSGLTDALDGIIARRFNQITVLGKVLDPIADKLTQLAVAGVLMIRWPIIRYLFILFIVKEMSIFLISYFLLRKGLMMNGAKWFGKIGTIVFYGCMFILVSMPEMSSSNVLTVVIITSFFQVVAFLGYLSVLYRMFAGTK